SSIGISACCRAPSRVWLSSASPPRYPEVVGPSAPTWTLTRSSIRVKKHILDDLEMLSVGNSKSGSPPSGDLLFRAKHLFVAAIVTIAPCQSEPSRQFE